MINNSTLLDKDAALFYDDLLVNKRGRVVATQESVNAILK
jgi:hypothetical protein